MLSFWFSSSFHVCHNDATLTPLFIFKTPEPSQKVARFQIGHWNSSERAKNMRNVLEKVASRLLLDPLLPDTWYHISRKNVAAISVFKLSLLSFHPPFLFLLALHPCVALSHDIMLVEVIPEAYPVSRSFRFSSSSSNPSHSKSLLHPLSLYQSVYPSALVDFR